MQGVPYSMLILLLCCQQLFRVSPHKAVILRFILSLFSLRSVERLAVLHVWFSFVLAFALETLRLEPLQGIYIYHVCTVQSDLLFAQF